MSSEKQYKHLESDVESEHDLFVLIEIINCG